MQLLPASANKLFQCALNSIPSAERNWASWILEVLLYSLRPLTLSEFHTLHSLQHKLSLDIDHISQLEFESRLKNILGGVVIFRRGEVHLAHSRLRDYLLSSRLVVRTKSQIHVNLTELCLQYINSAECQSLIAHRVTISEIPTLSKQENFMSYAVKYWPLHAKVAESSSSIDGIFTQTLLDNEGKSLSLWAQEYGKFVDPIPTGRWELLDPCAGFPILAKHGLQQLLVYAMDRFKASPSFNKGCFHAVASAAAGGHASIVRLLLAVPKPESEKFDTLVLDAIEFGDEEIIKKVISRSTQEVDALLDISALSRAASLNQKIAVDLLLSWLKLENPKINVASELYHTPHAALALYYACQRNCVEVVTSLLQTNINDFADLNKSLCEACKFGHSQLIDPLLDAANSLNDKEEKKIQNCYSKALKTACRFGQYECLQTILKWIRRHDSEYKLDLLLLALAFEFGPSKCS